MIANAILTGQWHKAAVAAAVIAGGLAAGLTFVALELNATEKAFDTETEAIMRNTEAMKENANLLGDRFNILRLLERKAVFDIGTPSGAVSPGTLAQADPLQNPESLDRYNRSVIATAYPSAGFRLANQYAGRPDPSITAERYAWALAIENGIVNGFNRAAGIQQNRASVQNPFLPTPTPTPDSQPTMPDFSESVFSFNQIAQANTQRAQADAELLHNAARAFQSIVDWATGQSSQPTQIILPPNNQSGAYDPNQIIIDSGE